MQAACEQVGVKIHFNSHIQEVLSNSSSVNGVKFTDGSVVNAGVVVNCAGPWFEGLNKSVGVKTSTTMLPTRIQVGHKTLPDDEDLLSLPFVADFWGNSGIYFMPRRANKQLVFGSVAHRFESEIGAQLSEIQDLQQLPYLEGVKMFSGGQYNAVTVS